jgi:hypothetical protein
MAQWWAEGDGDPVHVVSSRASWQAENPATPLPEPLPNDIAAVREREAAEAELDTIAAVHARLLWKRQAEEAAPCVGREYLGAVLPAMPVAVGTA